ncbi:MAG: hypothetical protein U5N26_10845 [Candidatus Marinimicrobia bacterium]|nr:hypothetical protein [Candidatus Neomarinimicrobiota bacterium]
MAVKRLKKYPVDPAASREETKQGQLLNVIFASSLPRLPSILSTYPDDPVIPSEKPSSESGDSVDRITGYPAENNLLSGRYLLLILSTIP